MASVSNILAGLGKLRQISDDPHCEHLVSRSAGRRVFRELSGGVVKIRRNRIDYTGGGAKTGAKRPHFDYAFGKLARSMALEQARQDDFRQALSDLPKVRAVPVLHASEPAEPLNYKQNLVVGNCRVTLVCEGGQLVSAHCGGAERSNKQRRHNGRRRR